MTQLQLSTSITLLVLFASQVMGQNYLLEMFHPLSEQFVALQTDSMFIRNTSEDGKETRREVAYIYDKNRLTECREIRHEANKQFIYSIKSTYNLDEPTSPVALHVRYDSLTKMTYQYRQIGFSQKPGVTDSFYLEGLNGEEWVRSQITKYQYHPSGQIEEQADYKPSDKPGEWVMSTQTIYDYDNAGRAKQRISNNWPSVDENYQNAYQYHYKDSDRPHTENWYHGPIGKALPVDSTYYYYDAEGKYDSAYHFTWVAQMGSWYNTSRETYPENEQKRTLIGNKSHPDAMTGAWKETTKHGYTSGSQIYSDEPFEHIIERYNPETNVWEIKNRQTTNYELYETDKVFATFKNEGYSAETGQWETDYLVEAWLRLRPDSLKRVEERDMQFKFSYICGMPNPYIANQTIEFPERAEFPGKYELCIMSSDGRMIYHETFDESGRGAVDAVLLPGFYIAFVRKGGMPVCSQKLVVN